MDGPLIASFDIGTTAAKGVLIDRERGIVAQGTAPYATAYPAPGWVEQEPEEWWGAARALAGHFRDEGWDLARVEAIALTGQMQDLILVDEQLRALRPAILYSDGRAGEQGARIARALAAIGVLAEDRGHLDAASPAAKLRWLREHEPETAARCYRALFNAKDYLLARLAGVTATDATTAATTGIHDAPAADWRRAWLATIGIPEPWLPPILPVGRVAGRVGAVAAAETGFRAGTAVYPGTGDAAAATLSAGLLAPCDTYIYLGGSAWAATIAEGTVHERHGVWSLPSAMPEHTIAIAPLLNAGSAQRWMMRLLGLESGEGTLEYAALERLLAETPGRSGDVLFLPYLNGERCPVQDGRALGTFLQLGAATGRGELAWAVLEGIGFSLRQVIEALGPRPRAVRAVGGMARSARFAALIADICDLEVATPELPFAAGALAAATPVAVDRGWYADLASAVAAWFPAHGDGSRLARPSAWRERYGARYETFTRIYPLVAQIG